MFKYIMLSMVLLVAFVLLKYILTIGFLVMLLTWVFLGINPFEQALIVLALFGLARR